MRHRKVIIAASIATGVILLLWLACLPSKLFDGVPYSTVVLSREGELLGARVADDGQWRFPPCDSLPEKFVKALIEYEDRTFYSHPGVSARGLGRALKQNFSNGRVVSGGSTITMQTIRLHRRGPRNLIEKVIEIFMATRLELRCSKEEILRLYASHAPFGGNVVGLNAAMWRYLGNNGDDMSWAEAATLAVMQNAPSVMHLSRNRDKLQAKRDRLLERLYQRGVLTDEEYELALEEPLIGQPFPMPRIAPHYVDRHYISARGKSTKTSIVYGLQQRLETVTDHWRRELSLSGVKDLAAVIVKVKTGETVAYCGNAGMNSPRDGMWVDIAMSPRSSGSILKPLLYCAAIQDGLILPHTLLPDIPTDFGGFAPKNFDGEFSGAIDAARALSLSLNVPNVWLLQEYGISRFATLLKQSGLRTINKPVDEYGLSLILGGAEVTLQDIVNSYAALARFDRTLPLNDSVAIYAMFDAMRDVGRPDELDSSRATSVQDIAWKTGTSYGARDGWAVGVTPEYAVGVWTGNADGSGVATLTGARTAGPVMFDIFNLLPSCGWWPEPSGRLEKVCVHSGHLAGRDCAETRMAPVTNKALKSRVCPYCTRIPVSLDGERRVVNASEPMMMKSYFQLPPVHKLYYRKAHPDYIEPPVDPDNNDSENLRIIYPDDGAVISLPRRPDRELSLLVCRATHSDAAARLFWHLDGNFIGETTDIHTVTIHPAPGFHRLTVYDQAGASTTVGISITDYAGTTAVEILDRNSES